MPGLLDDGPITATITHEGDEPATVLKSRLFVRNDGATYLIDQLGAVVLRLTSPRIVSPGVLTGELDGHGTYTISFETYRGCNCGANPAWSRDTAARLGGCPPDEPCGPDLLFGL